MAGPVRAVLFDLDHTLFDTEKTERHALAAVARAVGVRLRPQAVDEYRRVNTEVWSQYRAGRITSKELRVLRFRLWLEKLNRDPTQAERMGPLFLEVFSSRADLVTGASRVIRAISDLGLRLGIVTNGIDRVQRRRLRVSALMDSFRVVVTSERAGVTKPDPRIMEIALKRIRTLPGQAVYVGDDPEVDGLAANRAGVPFVWFNPQRTRPHPGSTVFIDHEIHRLMDLQEIVTPR